MTIYTEPKHLGDVLLVEVAKGWTKDRGAYAQHAAPYEVGTVLSFVGGKYVRYEHGQANAPAAIAAERIDASSGDTPGVVIARGATVALDALIWPDTLTDAQKATAFNRLEARGIIARATL